MAIDKAVDSTQLDGYFTDLADAIREKTGDSALMTPAEMVTAIAAIPSGGGVSTYSGDIVLQNVNADSIVIPVDVTGKYFIASVLCIESGTVSDGTVTLDDGYITWHSENSMIFLATMFHKDFAPTLRYRYQSNVADEYIGTNNVNTIYGYNGRRGTQVAFRNANTQISNITIGSGNANRKFCRTGLYLKFHYEVTLW